VTELEIAGRSFAVSNLDKVLWPEAGFTKRDVLEYYREVAPVLLPHLTGRATTLRRFPDGVEAGGWYQLQWPRGAPEWLPRVRGRDFELAVVDDLPSLLWAANLAALELHPLLAKADRPDEPTAVVFDLDPGMPADVIDAAEVALLIRDRLAAAGLESFPKTSGSIGMHVLVPLNSPATFAETKSFARTIARSLPPERVVTTQNRKERAGRVLVDWLQNDASRSTVAPYSLRAVPFPTVSTPLAWDEVAHAVATKRPELLIFLARDALARIDRHGDLFAPVLDLRQSLPRLSR
jgi:bifunctional non-homologous end joining protein LigD